MIVFTWSFSDTSIFTFFKSVKIVVVAFTTTINKLLASVGTRIIVESVQSLLAWTLLFVQITVGCCERERERERLKSVSLFMNWCSFCCSI